MFESNEAFYKGLRQMWEKPGGYGAFGKEAGNYIEEQLKDLRDIAYDDRWEIIGQRFWEKFFGGGDVRSVSETMINEINDIIEEVVSSMNFDMNGLESGVFRKRLTEKIFGEDGQLSAEEYRNAGKAVSSMMVDILANGFEISDTEQIAYLGEQIFGKLFQSLYGADLENIVAQNPGLADEIAEAYQEMITAGFDQIDLRYILENVPLEQWGEMVQLMRDDIKGAYADLYGEDLPALFGDKWEDIDFETLKLIGTLEDLGYTIDDFKKAAKGTESVDDFIVKLKELTTITDTETLKSFADYMKDVKGYTTEIDKISKMATTLKEGKSIDITELLNIAEAHGEVLALDGDIDHLVMQLENLKRKIEGDRRGAVRESLLESELL